MDESQDHRTYRAATEDFFDQCWECTDRVDKCECDDLPPLLYES